MVKEKSNPLISGLLHHFHFHRSIVMLAMHLSIPEVENSRKNTSDGMRRARKLLVDKKIDLEDGYVNF